MKSFFIIDDYTSYCLWDGFLHEVLPKLPSKPKIFEESPREELKNIPVGDWQIANGMHTMATPGAYVKAGIPQVTFEQLPAIFCVTDDGIVGQYRVKEKETEEFIRANL